MTGLARRAARALGLLLIVMGCGGLAWSLVVWRWQDPVTYLTNRHAQAELASRYEARLSASPATPRPVTRSPSWADVGRRLAREASRYRRTSGPGDPVARIRATFTYRVAGHRIVPATFLAALRPRGREELALQACWPRFFASHRYIARAVPAAVTLRDGLRVRLGG